MLLLPESIVHGLRSTVHIEASSVFGFLTSIVTSIAPVRSLTLSTCSHVLPPSLVRQTPRSGLGPTLLPRAALPVPGEGGGAPQGGPPPPGRRGPASPRRRGFCRRRRRW